jgi:DNA-binding PadR family transcriptional regulator
MPIERTLLGEAARFLPLTPQVFQILLSLSDQPLHGYSMIQDIRQRTDDVVRLTASTLYDALSRLVDSALIEPVEPPPDSPEARDSRRRYYALTTLGREVATLEAKRLERTLAMARDKRLLER